MTLVKGTAAQVQAFRAGFSTIFPVRDLLAFSPDELVILFGSAEEDWGADSASDSPELLLPSPSLAPTDLVPFFLTPFSPERGSQGRPRVQHRVSLDRQPD